MQNNIPAVIALIQFIYDNIMYAELNTKSDYCQECGYDGEIQIVEDEDGKLIWKCPNCGNRNQEIQTFLPIHTKHIEKTSQIVSKERKQNHLIF